MHVLLTADIIDIDNIRVLQPGSGLRLRMKFCHKIDIFRKLRLQYLYSDKATQHLVLRLIYVRHAAGSDLFQYLIAICYK